MRLTQKDMAADAAAPRRTNPENRTYFCEIRVDSSSSFISDIFSIFVTPPSKKYEFI